MGEQVDITAALIQHFGWGAVAMGILAGYFAKQELKAYKERLDKVERKADACATKDDLEGLKTDVKDGFTSVTSRLDRLFEKRS